MSRILVTTLAMVIFTSVAVPAIGAERARTQTGTQAQTYAGVGNGDCTQTQTQTRTQAQTQAQAGSADGNCLQTQTQTQAQAQIQMQVGPEGPAPRGPETYRHTHRLRHRPGTATDDVADAAPAGDALHEWLSSLSLILKEAFAYTFGRA